MEEEIKENYYETRRTMTKNIWVERIERYGFFIRGLIYIILGWFGIQLSLGLRDRGANLIDVISSLNNLLYGKIILILVSLGLLGYSFWGIARGIFNVLDENKELHGWGKRVGYLISAISYGSLAFSSLLFIKGTSVASASGDPSKIVDKVWPLPFGRELLLLLGLFWIFGAIGQLISINKSSSWLEKTGLISRAFIYGLIGGFIVRAAITVNPGMVLGIGQVMQFLEQNKGGTLIVAALSLGLSFFGIYSVIFAVYGKLSEA
jgi:hypothetical protein